MSQATYLLVSAYFSRRITATTSQVSLYLGFSFTETYHILQEMKEAGMIMYDVDSQQYYKSE